MNDDFDELLEILINFFQTKIEEFILEGDRKQAEKYQKYSYLLESILNTSLQGIEAIEDLQTINNILRKYS